MQNAIRKPQLLAITFILCVIQLWFFHNTMLDDPFITFTYSKNLANGAGIVWNPGEAPVEGYTNFTWMILNAFAIAIGLHPLLFSKIIGVIFTLVMVALPFT